MPEMTQVLSDFEKMSPDDLKKFGTELSKSTNKTLLANFIEGSLTPALGGLSTEDKAKVIKNATKDLPESDKQKIAEEVSGRTLAQPSQGVRDKLWLVVVVTFSLVLVGSFITLAIGVFVPASGKVTPELVLTMFTSVVGFLAGLFVPSPVNDQQNKTNKDNQG